MLKSVANELILARVFPTPMRADVLCDEEKIAQIAQHVAAIMKTLGLDLSDESLRDTPMRVAKMYVKEIFSGLNNDNFPKITTIPNTLQYQEMVTVKDISIVSVCEHHLVTIEGKATIAYIPDQKIIGLSKLNRIARFFSRRPQVQERLTKQIADCLVEVLETENVAVKMNARHFCVIQRGVEDASSSTQTADLRGVFKADVLKRTEFMQL